MSKGESDKLYFQEIIAQQKLYREKVKPRLYLKYPSQTERLFGFVQSMFSEVSEIHKLLKPLWSYWRKDSVNKWVYNLSEQQKQELIMEGVDLWKFLNEFFIELGVDSEEKLYAVYMQKHEVINNRLTEEGVVKEKE